MFPVESMRGAIGVAAHPGMVETGRRSFSGSTENSEEP
jgi:hypothetical protein